MVAMLGYVVIAVTCRRRRPSSKYTHDDDGGGGLAGLNARKRKTMPRVIRECELPVQVAPETRFIKLHHVSDATVISTKLDLGFNQRDVLAEPLI
jgi:hypothetical protein